MWLSRLLHTTSFRLALACAGLFTVILAALLAFTSYTTNRALENELRMRVEEDFTTFSEEAKSESNDAILKEIDERINGPIAPGSYYYVADAKGHKLLGNIDHVEITGGWQKLYTESVSRNRQQRSHEVWGEGRRFGDTFIFTGQDATRMIMAQRRLINSYIGSGLLAIALSLIAGLLLSRGLLKRIDAINATSKAIMAGNLKERIPVRGSSDEVDQLSNNLNKLFDSNQSLLESLRQVTVNIAHDLRTPLSRLRNQLEHLRDGKSTATQRSEKLDQAITESDHLLATFSALLRIAQIEAGTRKAVFTAVDLSGLAEKVHSIYGAVAEDSGQHLSARIPAHITCQGDPELLLQLCVNLVENAIRHTPKGTKIMLDVEAPARLIVSDNGPGIPAEAREKVLERFFRLDQSRSTPGSGLGLSLVAAIAHLHGSRIELSDNAPGLRASVNLQPT